MSLTVPSDIPNVLPIGDTWSWTRGPAFSRGLFPASEWTLAYRLVPPAGNAVDVTATQDGTTDGYTVTVASTTTAAITGVGVASWFARVTNIADTSIRYTVDEGTTELLANAATVTLAGSTTHAETMVTALEAELERRVTGTGYAADSVTVAGRSITLLSIDALGKLLNKYRAEVARQRTGSGFTPIVVGFGTQGYPTAGKFGQRDPYRGFGR